MSRSLVAALLEMERKAAQLSEGRGDVKGLRGLLRRSREAAQVDVLNRNRPRPPMRPVVMPGGWLADQNELENEAATEQPRLRSLEAQHETARQEREPEAAAARQYAEARREQARREAPPGIPL